MIGYSWLSGQRWGCGYYLRLRCSHALIQGNFEHAFPTFNIDASMSGEEEKDIIAIDNVQTVLDNSVLVPDFAGDSTLPPPPNLKPEQERRLWRKIDFRLIPMLSAMYLMAYMDRGTFPALWHCRLFIYHWSGNIGIFLVSNWRLVRCFIPVR